MTPDSRLTRSELELEVLRGHLDRLAGRQLVRQRGVLHGPHAGAREDDVAGRAEARDHQVQVAVVVRERLGAALSGHTPNSASAQWPGAMCCGGRDSCVPVFVCVCLFYSLFHTFASKRYLG